MPFAADYPFLSVLWTMLVFFAWVIWFWILITIFADLFRRHDIGGGKKALWIVFVILTPFLGVLIYLIANNEGMNERNVSRAHAQQAQFDDYVKTVSGGRPRRSRRPRACSTPAPFRRPSSTRSRPRRSPASRARVSRQDVRLAVAPLAALLVLVAAGGCGGDDEAASDPSAVEGVPWVLVSGVDVDGWEASAPSLRFGEDGTASGSSGCNQWGGSTKSTATRSSSVRSP